MRIVEIGDCSMVIMKDSEDLSWISVGDIHRRSKKYNDSISVEKWGYADGHYHCYAYQKTVDSIYAGSRLVLFFKDTVNKEFHLQDRVELHTGTPF